MAMTRKEVRLLKDLTSRDSRTLTAEEMRQATELYRRWRLIEPRRMPTDPEVDYDAVIEDTIAATRSKVDKTAEARNADTETEDEKRLPYPTDVWRMQYALRNLKDAVRTLEYVEYLQERFPPGSTDPNLLEARRRSRAVLKRIGNSLSFATDQITIVLRHEDMPLKVREQLGELYDAAHSIVDFIRESLEPVGRTPKQEYL